MSDLIQGYLQTSTEECNHRTPSDMYSWKSPPTSKIEEDAQLLLSAATTRSLPPPPVSKAKRSGGSIKNNKALASSSNSLQKHERNLNRALADMNRLCVTMDLSTKVRECACSLYLRVEQENWHRGKNTDTIIATCIFLACRQQGVPRTFKEICALTQVPRKDIGRTFKFLKDKLGTSASSSIMSSSSEDLMSRFCASLSLSTTAQKSAILLNKRAKDRDTLAGKSPVSVAGACIYMASHLVGQPRDAGVISHVAGVSQVTIKNSYKLLYADHQELILDDVLAVDPMASIQFLPVP